MSDDPTKTIDPSRVARGRSLHCPHCGSVAFAETISGSGQAGTTRKHVTCTGLDCNRLSQVVDIHNQTGEAVTVLDAAPGRDAIKTAKSKGSWDENAASIFRGRCRATGCSDRVDEGGLCSAHLSSWRVAGRPDMDQWLSNRRTTAGPAMAARRSRRAMCRAPGCDRKGDESRGLCGRHYKRWVLCDKPDFQQWLDAGGPTPKAWQGLNAPASPDTLPDTLGDLDHDDADQRREDEDVADAGFAEQDGGADDRAGAAAAAAAAGPASVGCEDVSGPGRIERVPGDRVSQEGQGQLDADADQETKRPVQPAPAAADDVLGDVRDTIRDTTGYEVIEGPDPISRALDDRWLNAQLTDLVPLPANTGQIVMGVIGSHFTVATTAGRVIWQCDLGEIRSAG